MKKRNYVRRLVALVLSCVTVFGMGVPTFAAEEEESNMNPPPGIVLQEGEVWIPATADEIVLYGDDDECGHYPPSGYSYLGRIEGDTDLDVRAGGIVGDFAAFFVPPPFNYTLWVLIEGVQLVSPSSIYSGPYTRYIYGPGTADPLHYYYHDYFHIYDYSGICVGAACHGYLV